MTVSWARAKGLSKLVKTNGLGSEPTGLCTTTVTQAGTRLRHFKHPLTADASLRDHLHLTAMTRTLISRIIRHLGSPSEKEVTKKKEKGRLKTNAPTPDTYTQ